MQAAVYRQIGPASDVLTIVDLGTPTPSAGEVRVRLRASGINPTDTRTRAGIFPIQGEWSRILPHHDGAGVIDAVGAGISERRVGQRVWLHSAQWGGRDGTAAEYVAVQSENAIELPERIDFDAGATFGVPLLTAYRAVTMDGDVAGKTLLVQGGAGAVGNYAIQLAHQKGATVIATVSSSVKAEAAERAGADHVINYREQSVVECIREMTAGRGVDHVVEVNLGANAMHVPELVRNGGFVAAYGTDTFTAEFPMVGAIVQQIRFGFFIVFMLPRAVIDKAVEDLDDMMKAGKITAPIHSRHPLSDIAHAHDMVDAASTIGNVVLTFD